ncbi:Nin one binding Zn-ribbon like-domain-containing protein [Rhizoctonia solani]|nr:Nin one binding Zn-ribbon like-domain-containing protein [Rhizoctonia solani]
MAGATATPNVGTLVLDAGPLLSLTPLRGLASRYVTVPQVIAELKDPRAREHIERLELTSGIKLEVLEPDVTSLAKVTAFSKKTGDYSVLSAADLKILALTCSLHDKATQAQADREVQASVTPEVPVNSVPSQPAPMSVAQGEPNPPENAAGEQEVEASINEIDTIDEEAPEFERLPMDAGAGTNSNTKIDEQAPVVPLYEDPPSGDDGEGEWITPDNVSKHKSRASQSIPSADTKSSGKKNKNPTPTRMDVACMTVDYAMQNVLLQMSLNLVGMEGRRVASVKSWVLRCHACFKICKDNTKKFCPTCGNATLLRTSVTTTGPGADGSQPTVQVHLKKNFQFKTRGTKYSVPLPKPGAAKGGAGSTNIILREDQVEFQKGVHQEAVRQRKEQKRMERALTEGKGSGMSWDDPDWIPEILTGTRRQTGGLPTIGHGRRNPNEVRRKKK